MIFAVKQKGEQMAEYVDLSECVTATFYSDEYEEWTQKTVTIADVLNAVCDDYTVLPPAQLVNIAKLQPNCNQVASDCASDCISRQAALEAIDTWDKFGCDPDGKLVRYDDDKHYIPYVHYEDMVHAINHLPPVQPDVPDTNVGKMCEYYDLCRNGRDEKKLREELLSAQPGWIPTSERLPDIRQWVLCQCRAGIMDVLRLTADGSWSKNYPHAEYMSGFVVAWMPLPTPWEGEKDDG